MHKKIFYSLSLFLIAILSGFSQPNNILSQLGIRGVTVQAGTTNYAGYLVKLNTNGVFDASVFGALPTNIIIDVNNSIFVDSSLGNDTVFGGKLNFPFKTINYALNSANKSNVVLFLSPGLYSGGIITNYKLSSVTFVALAPTTAIITNNLRFNVATTNIGFFGVTLNNFTYAANNPVTLTFGEGSYLQSATGVSRLGATNQAMTLIVYSGARFAGTYASTTANLAIVRIDNAQKIGYMPANTNYWGSTNVITTVESALNFIANTELNSRFVLNNVTQRLAVAETSISNIYLQITNIYNNISNLNASTTWASNSVMSLQSILQTTTSTVYSLQTNIAFLTIEINNIKTNLLNNITNAFSGMITNIAAGTFTTTTTGHMYVAYNNTFVNPANISITATFKQDINELAQIYISSVSTTGFTFCIRNSAGFAPPGIPISWIAIEK